MKRKYEFTSMFEENSSKVTSKIMEELRKAVRLACIKEGKSEQDAEFASQKFLDQWKKNYEELKKSELDKFEKRKRTKLEVKQEQTSLDNKHIKIQQLAVPQIANLPENLATFIKEDWDAEIQSEDDDTEELQGLYKDDPENTIITMHSLLKDNEKSKTSRIEFDSVAGAVKTTTFNRNYSTGFLFLDGREYVFSNCTAKMKF